MTEKPDRRRIGFEWLPATRSILDTLVCPGNSKSINRYEEFCVLFAASRLSAEPESP